MRILIYTMVVAIFACNAYAYIDPGSGGIFSQVLAAIAVAWGIIWRKIKGLFTGKKAEKEMASAIDDVLGKNEKRR